MKKLPGHSKNNQTGFLVAALAALVVIVAAVVIWQITKQPAAQPNSSPSAPTSPAAEKGFSKARYSINQASSLWVIVNKGRMLPSDYKPAKLVVVNVARRLPSESPEMHLRSETASAVEALVKSAGSQGLKLMLVSGYRSYSEQVAVYSGYVASDGQASADASSARPGHSEHQTGLAADLGRTDRQCELQACFGDTADGRWLAANAYKYGFTIRYQKTKQSLTGYEYEPWHIRYIGKDLAAQVYKSDQTLEQFFGLPTYTDYPVAQFKLQ